MSKKQFNIEIAEVLARRMFPDCKRFEIVELKDEAGRDIRNGFMVRHDKGTRVLNKQELIGFSMSNNVHTVRVRGKTVKLKELM